MDYCVKKGLLYDSFRLLILVADHLTRHMKCVILFCSLPEHVAIEVINAT